MSEKQSKSPEINKSTSGARVFIRRLSLLIALGTLSGFNADLQAAQPTSLTQASEKNDVFKVMSELIKALGKDYKYAGKQKDGSVIQCAQGETKMEAEKEVVQKLKTIAKGSLKIKFAATQLADKSWVIAGIAEKENVFSVMSDLIKQFGKEYKYAGKQKDGSVIQCAQGDSFEKARDKAMQQISSVINGDQFDAIVTKKQLNDGSWIVAIQGFITSEPSQPTAVSNEFESTILNAHNRLRRDHCASPLTWSDEAAVIAQQWANQLKKENCAFYHNSDNKGHGENLAWGTTGRYLSGDFVQMWYDEIKDYNFNNPGFSMGTGHFTQVVWKNTSKVGCAPATCNNGTLLVCNYSPPGNYIDQFKQEVLPKTCKK